MLSRNYAGTGVERYGPSMVYALPVWTLLVWATRIRNVLDQDASVTDLVVPVVLTLLAVLALVDRRATKALVVATVGVWLVRLPFVLAHHHSAPFKLVHAALAVVSVALAALTWRALARRPALSGCR